MKYIRNQKYYIVYKKFKLFNFFLFSWGKRRAEEGRGFHILKIVRKEKKTLIHLKNYYLKYFLAN